MAEFLSMEEADNRYGKKSKTNAALSLGIIGTALAAIGLLKVIKNSKEKIAYQAKIKNDKINKVLELLENDPEMRKRYDELT